MTLCESQRKVRFKSKSAHEGNQETCCASLRQPPPRPIPYYKSIMPNHDRPDCHFDYLAISVINVSAYDSCPDIVAKTWLLLTLISTGIVLPLPPSRNILYMFKSPKWALVYPVLSKYLLAMRQNHFTFQSIDKSQLIKVFLFVSQKVMSSQFLPQLSGFHAEFHGFVI